MDLIYRNRIPLTISLLFLLSLADMMCGFLSRKTIAHSFFAISLIISFYWFQHHTPTHYLDL
ncbi:DUF5993 family protein [Photobacterium angustum]|uniref:DUF5993 family protein n=1 Tax=Photobacterium angustum TaxID=661 RepID=UPI003D120B81